MIQWWMVLVWILYAEEDASTQQRRQFQLPKNHLPPFMQAKLESAQVIPWTSAASKAAFTVHGLASVRVGQPWTDVIAEGWTKEALFLLETYYQNASDAYILEVLDAWAIAEFEQPPCAAAVARAPHNWAAHKRAHDRPLSVEARRHLHRRHALRITSWVGLASPSELKHLAVQRPQHEELSFVENVCEEIPTLPSRCRHWWPSSYLLERGTT